MYKNESIEICEICDDGNERNVKPSFMKASPLVTHLLENKTTEMNFSNIPNTKWTKSCNKILTFQERFLQILLSLPLGKT